MMAAKPRAVGLPPEGGSYGAGSYGVRTALATAVILIAGGSSVFACPMCFGAEETAMIDATKLGIAVMLGILFVVQGAFLAFFLYLRNRAKRIAELELDTEWSELQRASRTS